MKELPIDSRLDDLLVASWQFPGTIDESAHRVVAAALARIDAREQEVADFHLPHPSIFGSRSSWMHVGAFTSFALLIFLAGAGCGLRPAGSLDKASVQTLIIDGPYRSYAAL